MLAVTVSLTTQVPAQSCVFDTAAHTVIDSVTVGLTALWQFGEPLAVRADYLAAAQTIQSFFQRPEHVRLPLWARTARAGRLQLGGYVRFRLDTLGRLDKDLIEIDMASPDVADNVFAAIKHADSANAFIPPSPAVRREQHGMIRLRFVSLPDTGETIIPLIRLVIPVLVADSAPEVISVPRLRYPAVLRQAGVGDRVLLEFLVRADGGVDPNTVDLIRADYQEFAIEAIARIKDARFRPARVAGCPVPSVVRMPIDFKVRRH